MVSYVINRSVRTLSNEVQEPYRSFSENAYPILCRRSISKKPSCPFDECARDAATAHLVSIANSASSKNYGFASP